MEQVREVRSTTEVLRADLPAEPSIGSVILDREEVAWQARQSTRGPGRVWVRAGTMIPMLSFTPPDEFKPWHRLLSEDGPVTVVYRHDPDA